MDLYKIALVSHRLFSNYSEGKIFIYKSSVLSLKGIAKEERSKKNSVGVRLFKTFLRILTALIIRKNLFENIDFGYCTIYIIIECFMSGNTSYLNDVIMNNPLKKVHFSHV